MFCGVLWLLLGTMSGAVSAQSFVVEPYLQRATPSSVEVHWETLGVGAGYVEWGKTRQLGQRAPSTGRPSGFAAQLYGAQLSGLLPNTRYFYRVHTGRLASTIFDLRTPPSPAAESNLRIVVMSDMQLDGRHPYVFRDLVRDGVMPLVSDRAREQGLAPALVLIPGDLVRHGARYAEWSDEFFAPLRPLAAHVPLYSVAGNHDEDSPHYFRYFALPSAGPTSAPEHWWSSDFSNVRVLGLDSNPRYRSAEQLDWLARSLASACAEPQIDFVFAALHHPELSELWPDGELVYSGLVSRALEQFSQHCGKPSVIFSGHTHAYARGHSRDAPVTLVSVASAGGELDREGEHRPHTYPQYVTSQDEYGFVLVDVKAGADPSYRIRRVSRGTPEHTRNNEPRDEVLVRRYNQPPNQPTPIWPRDEAVSPREVLLTSSRYSEPEADAQGAIHWQMTDERCNFERPTVDVWKQLRSEAREHEDQTSGPDDVQRLGPNSLRLTNLPSNASFCYRVRMRDSSLAWSPWSVPASFRTLAATSAPIVQKVPARAF
ncbi:MAG: hypothetical protein JWN48_172 [Myxococcaceae bacterium]|nr:hypothetical protein [Myxococcaceae bacterium]